MPTLTNSTSIGMRMASAAAKRTKQRRPPAPIATSTASRPAPARPAPQNPGWKPNFLRGGAAGAAPVSSFMPQGNAMAEKLRAKMPQHLTSMIRGEGLQNRYGPIVGPRAQMATVASFQGLGGFSFGRLTRWVTSATAAIASKDPAAILSVAAAAVPGGSTPPPVAPKPPQAPPPTGVEQFYTSLKPQNSTQTMMMVGAGVLGLGLVALLLRRR